MPHSLRIAPLALLAFLTSVSPSLAQTPNPEIDEFFKKHAIVRLDLEIGPKEMDALRREPRKYVKANLKEGDKGEIVYKDVGVHLKGAAGSFRGVDDKPGLTINMDKLGGEVYFHGLDKFHLANSVQDGSYVSELLCGELFRAAGVPASRCSHAIVSINGKPRGFYYLKEGYDGAFLRQHFKDRHGNLYDGGFLRDIDQPLQHLSGRDDVKPHEDLKKLLDASREPDVKKRFKKMEQRLEMNMFITYLALEVLCWDWDGYPMNRNNYRVYHDPQKDKIVFIPSGMDQMFHDPNGPLFPNFQGFVARSVLETPEGKTLYLKRVEELFQTVFRPSEIHKRLDELQAKVQPALASVDANAGRDYPNQIRRLKDAVVVRERRIKDELNRIAAEDGKKYAREVTTPRTAEALRKHVDFTKEELLLFRFEGAKGDKLTFRVEEGAEGPVVVFRVSTGSEPKMEPTVIRRLYTVAKNATWRIGDEKRLSEPIRISLEDLEAAFPNLKVEKK